MRLTRLSIRNFRGFASLELTLDPEVTLLVGANGAGKTALIEAAATALGGFLMPLSAVGNVLVPPVDPEQVRRVVHVHNGIPDLQRQLPLVVTAEALLDGRNETWARSLDKSLTKAEGDVIGLVNQLGARVQAGEPVDLPVIASHGARRGSGEPHDPSWAGRVGSRFDGYDQCLDAVATHRYLSWWMKQQTFIELQQRERNPGYRHPQLAAVQAAVRSAIDGVDRFWFDLLHDELRLETRAGVRSFAMMSDGYRNLIAIVADIAWRAAVLNPHYGEGASVRSAGVVLIDELELHLHPAWQLRVIADLQRTFPRIQFIATTHSPQVVGSVRREQVRLLHDDAVAAEVPFVSGRDANALLEDVFGVSPRQRWAQDKLDRIFRLLDDEEYEAARDLLAEVRADLGPDDAAVIRAQWVLDTEAAPS